MTLRQTKEAIPLQTAYGTYPVFITDGIGEQRFRITIRCLNLESEFYTFVSEDSADILCTGAHCKVESDTFKQWLVEQIKVVNSGSATAPAFYFGKTQFIQQKISVPRFTELENSANAYVGRQVIGELNDIIRVIGDQKTMHERQVWSTSTLYDALAKGFSQMQSVATCATDQEDMIQKLSSSLAEVQLESKGIRRQLIDSTASCSERHDQLQTQTDAELSRINVQLSNENKNIRQDIRLLALKMQELQAHQGEQVDLWKKIHSQQKAEMSFLKLECEKLKKELDQQQLDKTNQAVQIKDALRLLNEAQTRTSRQMNTIRGEMQYLRDMKGQQDTNTQSLADLKDMYLNLLPKLQQAYMSERRREASHAVNNLQRLDLSSGPTKSTYQPPSPTKGNMY